MYNNSHFERDYQARKMLAEEYPIAKEKILTFLMQLEGRKTIGSAIMNRFKTEYKKTIEEGETLETLAMMSPMAYYAIAEFKNSMEVVCKKNKDISDNDIVLIKELYDYLESILKRYNAIKGY